MMEIAVWLAGRRPPPPPDLGAAVTDGLTEKGGTAARAPGHSGLGDVLLGCARERLDAARARPGRVRQSAFDLLVADALITYACEAALESKDPETALWEVLDAGVPR
jgi:hypothetical protein